MICVIFKISRYRKLKYAYFHNPTHISLGFEKNPTTPVSDGMDQSNFVIAKIWSQTNISHVLIGVFLQDKAYLSLNSDNEDVSCPRKCHLDLSFLFNFYF